jgi:predicted flap endonuclease-1-like 5' DNA nuclease
MEAVMSNIKEIEGIGPAQGVKLVEAGIKTTEKLLEVAGSRTGRQHLAEATGISEKMILEWVNRADLFRVPGIGEEISDLLEAAGVDSVPELATRKPENLQAALVEKNEAKHLVRQVPSVNQVMKFVDEAKKLPKVVTH